MHLLRCCLLELLQRMAQRAAVFPGTTQFSIESIEISNGMPTATSPTFCCRKNSTGKVTSPKLAASGSGGGRGSSVLRLPNTLPSGDFLVEVPLLFSGEERRFVALSGLRPVTI